MQTSFHMDKALKMNEKIFLSMRWGDGVVNRRRQRLMNYRCLSRLPIEGGLFGTVPEAKQRGYTSCLAGLAKQRHYLVKILF
ncbi:hypothetical protein D3C79_478270 [compost metagenome]